MWGRRATSGESGPRWRPPTFDLNSPELRDLVRRSREVVLLAAVTGAVTGAFVRFFEYVVVEVAFRYVVEGPVWFGALAPGIGLALSAILLRTLGNGASPATADEYLRAFHDPDYPLRPRAFVGRIAASVTTLGFGGAMGMEGPSIYAGSAIGSMIQRRIPAAFRGVDHRTLLVAGAAAGVAAIFKAPATGAIFALEVPFQDQMARRMLLPALVASASGYVVFVALSSVRPIFAFESGGGSAFEYRDLAGAVLIGVCCALGARLFTRLIRFAKTVTLGPIVVRVVLSGVLLGVLFVIGRALTGESLTLGSGYLTIRWLSEEHAFVVARRRVAPAVCRDGHDGRRWGCRGRVHPAGGRRGGRRADGGRGHQPARSHALRTARHGGVPRRRLSGAARRGDVRGGDDGATGLHRPRVLRDRGGRTTHG